MNVANIYSFLSVHIVIIDHEMTDEDLDRKLEDALVSVSLDFSMSSKEE